MLKGLIYKTPKWVKNKYFLCAIIGLFWVAFLDNNNLINQWKWNRNLRNLNKEIKYYKVRIDEVNEDLTNLSTNPQNLERFAREKYYMKRPNEEIFVITKE